METTPDKMLLPEIWETEKDKELSIGQLKHHYLQLAKQNFQGKIFINENSGKSIRVSADGIMEWWRKARKREHIISIQLLDFFLENAVFLGEESDYQQRKNIESASQFESGCEINGKYFKVILTTRKAVYDIDKFRYFSLKQIEMI